MSNNPDHADKFEQLRQQAEELIRQGPDFASQAPTDILELIHELRIHQAELEIQNEELKRAQQELSKLHREFEDLYEFAPCGYVTLNAKGIITRVNLTGAGLLETARQYLSHSGFTQFIISGWESIYLTARQKAGETGEKQSIDLPLKREKESPLWVRADIEADRDETGAVIQWRMVLVDITERMRAEKERTQLEDKLRQAQKMESIGTLAGGIAHEINNILGIIIGNAELALDDVPEWNPAKDCLKEIRAASLRAKDVVRQILSFARKTLASRKPLRISTIIKESLKLIRATIPASIDIRQESLCDSEMILANPTEINQILMNFCSNSVHAMEEETGILEVRLETAVLNDRTAARYEDLTAGEYVKLTVKDTGKGIDPEIMDRLFDPYFTTKDVDKGLGMGLAVVFGLVKKHDGAIKIMSEVGEGTTAEVLFPITEVQAEVEVKESEDLPTATERILLVDDEASLVKMVKQMLKREGYEVVGKTSSTEALRLFQEESGKFDLIISDIAMPDMPGDRLAQELIKIRPNIPIILCTGHSDRIDEDKAKDLGIKAYAMKPLDKAKFTKMVRRVLDGKD